MQKFFHFYYFPRNAASALITHSIIPFFFVIVIGKNFPLFFSRYSSLLFFFQTLTRFFDSNNAHHTQCIAREREHLHNQRILLSLSWQICVCVWVRRFSHLNCRVKNKKNKIKNSPFFRSQIRVHTIYTPTTTRNRKYICNAKFYDEF